MKTVNTHALLIGELLERDLLRDYAYFLKFKYTFSSSQLNKGNRAKLSRLTGVSDKTVRVYIAKFIRLGWIRKDGGNYVFIRLARLYRNYQLPYSRMQQRCKITIDNLEPIGVIITKLASKLIEANLLRQEYVLSLKHVSLSSSEKRGLSPKDRNLLDIYTRNVQMKSGNKETVLSCKTFGSILGKSKSSGHAYKQHMVDLGLIEAERRYKVVGSFWSERVKKKREKLLRARYRIIFTSGTLFKTIDVDHVRMAAFPNTDKMLISKTV